MFSLKRRLRSLLIALAVLALSAGVALAGRGSHPVPAGQPAGPSAQNDQGDDGDGAEAPETEAPDADSADTETPETETPDAGGQTGEHPDNHGKLVSDAAHADTPAGFANHGAWVSSVAKANHGHDTPAAAASHGKSKGKNH